ncbi:MAG TPA: hypothetical protein VH143_35225 [Kofleriaceae bacterium]|nr:hypothetical protein [Kofleriaceae bacterium]
MTIPKISIVLVALCGVAGAQPQPDQPPVDSQPPPPPPAPPPTSVPVMTPTPTPPPAPEREVSIRELDNDRPDELAFAIGLGYERLPGGAFDLQQPNIASARLRLVSGLTFEPTVTISNTSISTDPGTGMSTTESLSEFGIASLVRYPLIRHHHVDFEIVGSIGFDVAKDDPTGDFNTKTTSTFGIGWGISIGYWLSRHWQLSATATNPLIAFSKTSQEISQTETMSTSNTTIGLTFEPTIAFMIHLYN